MKIVKNFLLALCALSFVALGAAMPWLVSRVQDARLSGFQENLELNSVNLTLRQETENTVPALQLVSKNYTESVWEGKTVLTGETACEYALKALRTLEMYGLAPFGAEEARKYGASTGPILLIADDGSSALVWSCTWEVGTSLVSIRVDDAKGKAVQAIIDSPPQYDATEMNDLYSRMESWLLFLEEYYSGGIDNVETIDEAQALLEDGSVRLSVVFDIGISLNDGEEYYNFKLDIGSNYTFFNFK